MRVSDVAIASRLRAVHQQEPAQFFSCCLASTCEIVCRGHKTESVYRRYAIVSEFDLAEAARRLDSGTGTISGTIAPKSGGSS